MVVTMITGGPRLSGPLGRTVANMLKSCGEPRTKEKEAALEEGVVLKAKKCDGAL